MKYSPSSPLRKRESSALSSIERFSTEEKERGNLGAKNRVCKQAYSADVQRRRKRGDICQLFSLKAMGERTKKDSLFFLCHSSKRVRNAVEEGTAEKSNASVLYGKID